MKSGIHFITLTIILGIFSLDVAPAFVVTDGLVGYWTFDQIHIIDKTVKDVWGDNNGTISGNPKVVPGHVGEAHEFDGARDFVNLTTLGDFDRNMGTSTFEAWFKTSNTTDWMTLINTHGAECPYWGIQFNAVNNRHGFFKEEGTIFIYNSIIRERGCQPYMTGGNFNIYDGEWHHIVYINEYRKEEGIGGRGIDTVYIDTEFRGVVDGSNRGWINFPFTEPVYLGARNFGEKSEGHFNGMIDEVRFYDRPLTIKEIRRNFESTTPYNVEPKGKLSTLWGSIKDAK